jgi:hypothetical protein
MDIPNLDLSQELVNSNMFKGVHVKLLFFSAPFPAIHYVLSLIEQLWRRKRGAHQNRDIYQIQIPLF